MALDYDAYGPAYSIYSSKDMLDNHDVMSHHLKFDLNAGFTELRTVRFERTVRTLKILKISEQGEQSEHLMFGLWWTLLIH